MAQSIVLPMASIAFETGSFGTSNMAEPHVMSTRVAPNESIVRTVHSLESENQSKHSKKRTSNNSSGMVERETHKETR